jgi:triphosphoribosyl-dephospho-CoA synthase
MTRVEAIAAAFVASCRDEIEAPKPGNVHVYAEGLGMTVADFLRSAEVAAPRLCAPGASVGARIQGAIEATKAAVGQNTNLGIVLLAAPLAAAAESGGDLRHALNEVLAALTRADADAAFRAIVLAGPAGLGDAPHHDVRAPAETTLLEAMREAAGRDRIAHQYASGFADVFEIGLGALEAARRNGHGPPWIAVGAHLAFLSLCPDSHILRKHGAAAAAWVLEEASALRRAYCAASDPAAMLPALLCFDNDLKNRGLNPGTTADLVVATLFADRLKRSLIAKGNND